MSPDTILDTVDLSEFDVYDGDCVNIAVALKQIFGGTLVGAYANEVDFHDGLPAHVATEINGTLYDGGGTTSRDALRERAHYGSRKQEWDDIIVTEIERPDRQLFDPEKTREIKQNLIHQIHSQRR